MKEIHITEAVNGYQVRHWDKTKTIWTNQNFKSAMDLIGWLALDLTDQTFSVTLMPTTKEKDNG